VGLIANGGLRLDRATFCHELASLPTLLLVPTFQPNLVERIAMDLAATADPASICDCCRLIPRIFDYRTRPPRWLHHCASFTDLLASGAQCTMCKLIVMAFERAGISDAGAGSVALEYSLLKARLKGFKASVSENRGRTSMTVVCLPTDGTRFALGG